ncbi:transglycosylase SLT domain-containing protein, partial [Alistipes ihumii]|uniref:transglycosylase SLT domain-containing protein n=1 Tax=Alistipes ihumii TaxID=1470347 RepID=UPI003AB35A58
MMYSLFIFPPILTLRLFSVIKVESGFNKDAVSSVGARGLMQLMEDAYDWIKYRL